MAQVQLKNIGKMALKPVTFCVRELCAGAQEQVSLSRVLRFMYVAEGSLSLCLFSNGAFKQEILQGELVFIDCNVSYGVTTSEKTKIYCLEFEPTLRDGYNPFDVQTMMPLSLDMMLANTNLKHLTQNAGGVYVITDSFGVAVAMKNLIFAYQDGIRSSEDACRAQALTALFFTEVAKSAEVPTQGYVNYVKRAYAYVQKNMQKSLRLEDVANAVGLNKTYLASQFKKYTGKTVMEAAREVRLLKSVQLLKESNLSVTEIATAVGFSYTQFLYEFKKAQGVSPAEFRKASKQ